MPENNSILSTEAQGMLIDYEADQDAQFLLELETEHLKGGQVHHYTGARWVKNNPDRARLMLALLGRGESVRAVSNFLQVHDRIVARVAQTYASELEALKKDTSKRMRHVSRLAIDELEDRLTDRDKRAKISAKDLALIVAIMQDKARELEGGPDQRIEISISQSSDIDMDAALRQLRHVEDAASQEMSSRAGNKSAKGAALPAAEAAVPRALDVPADHSIDGLLGSAEEPESTPISMPTDNESDGCCHKPQENNEESA